MEWLYLAIFQLAVTCIGAVIAWRKLKTTLWNLINDFAEQFSGELSGTLQEAFTPQVSKAMSILGSQGGSAKAVKELKGKLTKSFIDKNFGTLKLIAERFLDIDVEELIEEYSPETILQAMKDFAPLVKGLTSGESTGGLLSGILGGQASRNNSGSVPSM